MAAGGEEASGRGEGPGSEPSSGEANEADTAPDALLQALASLLHARHDVDQAEARLLDSARKARLAEALDLFAQEVADLELRRDDAVRLVRRARLRGRAGEGRERQGRRPQDGRLWVSPG